MTAGQIYIATPRGPRIAASQTGGSIPPGLALCLVPMDDQTGEGEPWHHTYSQWSITHILSGRRIGPGWEERRDAQRCAESLAGIVDWTVPHLFLADDADVRKKVTDALDRFAADMEDR